MKRRVILEQDDNYYNDNYYNDTEEYFPERGEAFYQGFSGGLLSAGKVVLVIFICLIIYMIIAC